MNKDNARDYLPLVKALAEGKTIEIKRSSGWHEIKSIDTLEIPPSMLRIKPNGKEAALIGLSELAESFDKAQKEFARIGVALKAAQGDCKDFELVAKGIERIKPEPKKDWIRLVLHKNEIMPIENESDEIRYGEKHTNFVRWLTDRIEYELPQENITSASKCNHEPMLICSPMTEEQLKRPLCRRCGKKIVFNGRDWVEYTLPEGDA